MTQYYEVLGLNPAQHNIYDIELAYWTLVQKYHPSRNFPESSEAAFYEVTMAFFYINDYEFGRRPTASEIAEYREKANYWATLSWDELKQVAFFKKLMNSTQEPASLKFIGFGLSVFLFLIPLLIGYFYDNRFIPTVLYGFYAVLFLYYFLKPPPVQVISNPFKRWWYVFKTHHTLLISTLLLLFILSYFQITFRTFEVHAVFLKSIITGVLLSYLLLSLFKITTFFKRIVISVCIIPNLIQLPVIINFITAHPVLEVAPRYFVKKSNYSSTPRSPRSSGMEYYVEYSEPNFRYFNHYVAFTVYFDNSEMTRYTHNLITMGEGVLGWKTVLDNDFVWVRDGVILK